MLAPVCVLFRILPTSGGSKSEIQVKSALIGLDMALKAGDSLCRLGVKYCLPRSYQVTDCFSALSGRSMKRILIDSARPIADKENPATRAGFPVVSQSLIKS